MPTFRVGNAPCSWGALEFENVKGEQIPYNRMLDELVETGYTGVELGDWGYMPTDPAALQAELDRRNLVMLGAFVPVGLKHRACHEPGLQNALKTARLLAAVARHPKPYLVLADDNGSDPQRTKNAGRITPDLALTVHEWHTFAEGANEIARTVLAETGLRTVFHHHCAGYIETPREIERLLDLTDSRALGLVFDTGHFAYGSRGADTCAALAQFKERIWYVHFKDCDPHVAERARTGQWDYFEALRHGVFCELGKGCIDFPAVLHWLKCTGYDGYVLVEQDVLPGMGAPKESALRNREYLRTIQHCYEGKGAACKSN